MSAESIDITADNGERVRTQHIARVLPLSIFVFFLTGCQVFTPVGDFIGQRYTNTASYFNTYYNARKMFSEAETEVLATIQANREKGAKGQTVVFVMPSTARQKFTTSIEKNSKLLSYYPTSKYVDDALLMIGKSYYYLEEDVKAERKFLELISQYPESGLVFETKLWYGKSLLRQERNTEGLQMLGTLYTDALEDGDDDIAGRAALAVGEYYFAQNDFVNALKFFGESVAALGDGEENARTQFQIGICHSKLDETEEARKAFHAVGNFSPDYNTAFQASVYESRMLTRQEKFDPALEILFDRLDDSKFTEYFGTAHREVGNTYYAQGNIDEAVAQYRYVDTAYARTDDAARSMFALASLYEHTLFEFDSARTYYNKARVEFSGSEITPEAAIRSEIFGKYFILRRDLANYDTLIMETIHPRPVKIDSLALAKQDSIHRADSLAHIARGISPLERLAQKQRDTAAIRPDSALAGAGGPSDSTARADSTLRIAPKPVLTKAMRDSLARMDTLAVLAAAAAKQKILDSLATQVVRVKFELAGLMYLEMNRPDSALVYYADVVAGTKDSSLAARSYFTMAEIYGSQDSLSKAKTDSIYRLIIAIAPKSSYAQEARKNIGIPLLKEETDSAQVFYWAAERELAEGTPKRAIPLFRSLAARFARSPYAPKALYTVGWIFENTLVENDSAEAAYNELAEKYPASTYTVAAQPKLTEIANAKREAEAKIKAEADAKAKIEAEAKAAKDKEEAEKKAAKVKEEAEKLQAKAEKEAKAKAEADKLKPPAGTKNTTSSGVDSSAVPMPADSAAVHMRLDTTMVKPVIDTTAQIN